MKKTMLYGEDALPIQNAMKYRSGEKCCGMRRHFVSCDISGSYNALPAHCTFNAVLFEVSQIGTCDWFQEKEKK